MTISSTKTWRCFLDDERYALGSKVPAPVILSAWAAQRGVCREACGVVQGLCELGRGSLYSPRGRLAPCGFCHSLDWFPAKKPALN